MKGLGITRLATATIKARKREYLGLALGILLAIALVFTLLFAGGSQYVQIQADWRAQVGGQDTVVFDTAPGSSQDIQDLARELGQVVVVAQVAGEEITLGYYDQAAADLLERRLLAGRMPETPDEIALDRGALGQLRLSEDLGQDIRLELMPLSSSASQSASQRSFRLVGILMDQRAAQGHGSSFYGHVHALPAGLVAPQPPLPGSRTVSHWVLKLAGGTSFKALQDRLGSLGLDWHEENYQPSLTAGGERYVYMLAFALLCLALLLCAVIAILNVFSNRLKQREQQIGMLRAVGATRRQIRLIYGQEALLIALVTAPLAILLSLGLARLLLRFTTGAPLAVPPLLIPLGLLASLAVVMLSAAWPLRAASRLSPIRVIRDADWMLTHRRLRVKSRASFQPHRLLSSRFIRLHRRSATGASLLITLCMLVLCMLTMAPFQMRHTSLTLEERPAFSMYRARGTVLAQDVNIVSRARGLTAADLAQVAALPGVSRVAWSGSVDAMLVVTEPAIYLTDPPNSSLYELHHLPPDFQETFSREEQEQMIGLNRQSKARTQQALQTTGDVMRVEVKILDPAELAALAPLVTAGRLDLARINQGAEWLVYAPDLYTFRDGHGSTWTSAFLPEGSSGDQRFVNDAFRAGELLDLRQLFVYSDEYLEGSKQDRLLDQARKPRAQRPVGAVIDGPAPKALDQFYGMLLITTPEGLQAMGLHHRGPDQVQVFLSGMPDRDSEEWLHQQLVKVGLRDPELQVHNALQGAREMAQSRLQTLALFVSLLAVFFALCLSLLNNSLTGRLRADRRAIGSLRALGADNRVLGKIYARQLLYMLLGGVIPGALLSLAFTLWQGMDRYRPFPLGLYGLVAALEVALVALMFALSYLHVRRRLKGLLRQLVITQIREMG